MNYKPIPRARWHTATCIQCSVTFQSNRSDAKLCSARCRKARSRHLKQLKRAQYMLEHGLSKLATETYQMVIAADPQLNDDMLDLACSMGPTAMTKMLYIIRKTLDAHQ